MKKGINQAVKRVKQAYGIEATLDSTPISPSDSEPILDLETMQHQRFTDKVMIGVDSAIGVTYGGFLSYCAYSALSKVPEVITQVASNMSQYIPFVNS